MNFAEAKLKVHPVETQWHYLPMTAKGFEAKTKTAVGFVRSYDYERSGHVIRLTTGANADYWTDLETGQIGLWRELEPHLLSLDASAAKE